MPDIVKLLSMPEGKTLEFKRDLNSLQPILKTLVAFANTAGGVLIIGRDDEGNVPGIDDVFKAEEKLASAIADSIHPPLMPEIETISLEGKSLLVVCVAHWWGPFYLKAKGPLEGVFVRLGSTSRPAGEELLDELNRYRSKVSFDQMPSPDIDISGLDNGRIQKVFSKVGKEVDENKLISLGVLVPYGKKMVCSNGGIILFGHDDLREKYFSNTQVRCARFLGTEKSEFLDQYDIEGSILDAIEEVPKFIRKNTRMASKFGKIQREDIPEYSPVAVREILVNALVHADYSIRGMNPRVAIFSDRMEIESPGMLPFGYTLDDFISGVSHVRNKVIARVFRELRMMEEWGSGYKRISEDSLKGRYDIPLWEELGTALRVTLFPCSIHEIKPKLEKSILLPRQEEILALFRKSGKLTAKEIHVELQQDISERLLRSDLLELKKRGLVKKVGKGPGTFWIIA